MAWNLGIIASSAGGFVATGGTVIDAGGYRHHIFNSSGTFSVLSGEKTVYAFTQDGGNNGGNWYGTYNGSNFDYYSGSGGNAGLGNYTSLGFIASQGNHSVTVGASGSQTTVSGAAFDVTTGSKSGGQGGFAGSYANYYCDWDGICYLYWSSYLNDGASGQSSTSNNIVALNPTLYNALSLVRPDMTTGGGGGGGAIQNYTTGVYRSPASGGSFGGTTGATNSANASNAAANTGAGGGGGFLGVTFNSGNGVYTPQASYNSGSGGSGYAILSYSLT